MENNFTEALEAVLKHEGGWADHPRDPGGATMKGITLHTFRLFYGHSSTKQDLRAITSEQLATIYSSGYWDKCSCDKLPSGVDYAVFDAAVNSGPSRSARWLQVACGARVDGIIGPKTLKAAEAAAMGLDGEKKLVRKMLEIRMEFLRGLRHWPTFGKGWTRRIEDVELLARLMIETRHDEPAPPAIAESVELEDDTTPSCLECRWMHEVGDSGTEGECRYNPPYIDNFPTVDLADGWCRLFQKS